MFTARRPVSPTCASSPATELAMVRVLSELCQLSRHAVASQHSASTHCSRLR